LVINLLQLWLIMYIQELQLMGLSKNQAEIYSLLVKNGTQSGAEITKRANISRQLTYKVIDELVELELAQKHNKKGSVSTFTAAHPSSLQDLLLKKQAELDTAQTQLGAIITSLISEYNLEIGKPSVRFLEGESGVSEILRDSLSAQEEIYTYADIPTIEKYAKKTNDLYMKKRIKNKIPKKILAIDGPEMKKILKTYSQPYTEIRLISSELTSAFAAAMEVYDGKVSYLTFKDGILAGTILYDESIYKMHRFVFEALWEKAVSN